MEHVDRQICPKKRFVDENYIYHMRNCESENWDGITTEYVIDIFNAETKDYIQTMYLINKLPSLSYIKRVGLREDNYYSGLRFYSTSLYDKEVEEG